jgi:hypothetical protein
MNKGHRQILKACIAVCITRSYILYQENHNLVALSKQCVEAIPRNRILFLNTSFLTVRNLVSLF